MVKKRTKDWAIFIEGLQESTEKRKKRMTEVGVKLIVTVMQPEQICMLGRKLGVINHEN